MVDESRSTGPGGGELWRNRLDAEPSPDIRRVSDSLSFDQRLFREDIAGSRAHVAMLAHVGLLDEADLETRLGRLLGGEEPRLSPATLRQGLAHHDWAERVAGFDRLLAQVSKLPGVW